MSGCLHKKMYYIYALYHSVLCYIYGYHFIFLVEEICLKMMQIARYTSLVFLKIQQFLNLCVKIEKNISLKNNTRNAYALLKVLEY